MEKIFISYKQSSLSEEELNKTLGFLRKKIEKENKKTFIYYFDEDSSLEAKVLNKKFLENIKKSDIFISFLNYKEKSEGQLMELGMAYSLGKKIILLVNNSIKDNYFLSYGTSEQIYFFDKLEDLDFKKIINLKNY